MVEISKDIIKVDVGACEDQLKGIQCDCVSNAKTNEGIAKCDSYSAAAKCLNKQYKWTEKGANNWFKNLPSFFIPYCGIKKDIDVETSKATPSGDLIYDISSNGILLKGVNRVFWVAISLNDVGIINNVSSAIKDSISKNDGSFKKLMDLASDGMELKLETSHDKAAAMILLWTAAYKNNDKFKDGWEQKYLNDVLKYF